MRREADLILIVACSLALTAVILGFPFATPARVALGLPFVLFFPGYALIGALFPSKDDLNAVERIALSIGLSIAIVPLIGLSLNYSPWGIRLYPILAFVTLFIVLAAAVALVRRRMLPAGETFRVTIDIQLPRGSLIRLPHTLLAVGAVLALVTLGATAYLVATSPNSPERFTEFYVLGPGGRAEAYPNHVSVGQSASVILGLANHEGQDTAYQIAVTVDGQKTANIDTPVLADSERWETPISLVPSHTGDNQQVELLLYKEGRSEPYRRLHLWLDVAPALAQATPRPEALPPPTPATNPSATPPVPAPTDVLAQEQAPALGEETPDAQETQQVQVHVVAPGENLTRIARRYQVPLKAVIAANDLENPDLIYPQQEILIPAGSTPGESE